MNTLTGYQSPSQARGFSLAELLVASTIGCIVLLIVAHLYISGKAEFRKQQVDSRLLDNARYLAHYLASELRRGGFSGLYLADINRRAITTDCVNAEWVNPLQYSVTARDDNQAAYRCLQSAGRAYRYFRGDILTIRYALAEPARRIQSPFYYLLSAPGKYKLVKPGENANAILRQFSLSNSSIASRFQVNRAQVNTLYLGRSGLADCGSIASSGMVPSLISLYQGNTGKLRRKTIASGVEQMQFQYGELNRLHNKVMWRSARYVEHWNRVVAVKVWILLRSLCPLASYRDSKVYQLAEISYRPADRYRRLLLQSTFPLHNRIIKLKGILP